MGNKILDILSKAAEDAVDAAEARKQKQISDAKPTMLNLQPVAKVACQGCPPPPPSNRAGMTEQKTKIGLTPIQPNRRVDDVQTFSPKNIASVFENGMTAGEDILHLQDAIAAEEAHKDALFRSENISTASDASDMDISLDIDLETTAAFSQEIQEKQAIIDALQAQIAKLNASLEEVQSKLSASESRVLQLQEKLIRTSADFDNYRKRTARDQEQFKLQAAERIISDFLTVQDNFERAIQHAQTTSDFDSLMHGVKLTNKMYTAALGKHGCVSFDSLGQIFDPNYHDVLNRVEDDTVANNTIVQEHLKGYKMNDHLLRPALVVVAQNSNPSSSTHAVSESQAILDASSSTDTH